MIRHIAMFTLEDDAPEGTVAHLEEGLFLLAQTIDEISAYTYGADLRLRDGTWDFAVVADFETPADFRAYAEHPDHVAFIKERLTPVLKDRASLQFEL